MVDRTVRETLGGLTVCVTGSCGFVGSHVVDALLAMGCNVTSFDLQTPAASATEHVLAAMQARSGTSEQRWLIGDVRDPDMVQDAVESANLCLHLAAQSHVDASIDDPAGTMSTNAVGTQVVAAACARLKVPMVYCSTDEVHGDVYGTPWYDRGADEERTPLDPSSPYSAGKAAGEMAVRAAARTFGLRAAIVRGCNAFGARQCPEKLLPIACRLLQRGDVVPLHGGGLQERQWIAVEEFAGVLAAAGERLLRGEDDRVMTWNAAGPRRCTVLDLVDRLGSAAWRSSSVSRTTVERPGQDRAYHLSWHRTASGLSIRPSIDIFDRLPDLLRAYAADGEVRLASFIPGIAMESL